MIGIDTNVLVRYLVRDDEFQFEKARRLIKHEIVAGRQVLVSQLVMLETEWVLRSRYSLSKTKIVSVFSGLLNAMDIQIEDEATIEAAIYVWKESSADFADCLIGAKNRQLSCNATATFDERAAKLPTFALV